MALFWYFRSVTSLVILVITLIASTTKAAPVAAQTYLEIKVYKGESPATSSLINYYTLRCDATGGTAIYLNKANSCALINSVNGNINSIRPETEQECTDNNSDYSVFVSIVGYFRGGNPVNYENVFDSMCDAENATGGIVVPYRF